MQIFENYHKPLKMRPIADRVDAKLDDFDELLVKFDWTTSRFVGRVNPIVILVVFYPFDRVEIVDSLEAHGILIEDHIAVDDSHAENIQLREYVILVLDVVPKIACRGFENLWGCVGVGSSRVILIHVLADSCIFVITFSEICDFHLKIFRHLVYFFFGKNIVK